MDNNRKTDVNMSESTRDLQQLVQQILDLSDLLLQALDNDDTAQVIALNSEINKITEAIHLLLGWLPSEPR